jgi:RNA 3'-terminal phosphate cyclase (ATP)
MIAPLRSRVPAASASIVRHAVAFSALLGRPVRITNARARRSKPGLRPQHLTAVQACAELCDARTEGLAVGSSSFSFEPRSAVRGGRFHWDIGTAGSATMLALGVLPLACRAQGELHARISGGVFQDFAPSPYHLAHVLAPLLERMGAQIRIEVARAGYVPSGEGVLDLHVVPAPEPLAPLALTDQGAIRQVEGIAFSSHLERRRVSERMARACQEKLLGRGLACRIACVSDLAAKQPGAGLAIWAHSATGAHLGADRAGAPRRSSEAIGRFVAESLLDDLASGASVDRHAADQLVPFAALAGGSSVYRVPRVTDHLRTNLWLAGCFGARCQLDDSRVLIQGLER